MLAAKETIGFTQKVKRNHWFDEECEEVTVKKNKAYKEKLQRKSTRAAREKYQQARRNEKRIHRKKKRKYMGEQIKMIEDYQSKRLTRDNV